MEFLNQYAKKVRSQFGEDGILEHIFDVIGTTSRICVEFGAWDGEHFSNTWHWIVNHQWRALLMEAHPQKFQICQQKFQQNPNVRCVNTLVSHEGEAALENILNHVLKTKEIDLLSVDVDGNEYEIWKSLNEYRPRVVVIEFNPTIPPHLDIRATNPDNYFGCSIRCLYNLAKDKGYELVCCTLCNGIFVDESLYPKFNMPVNDPDLLMPKDNLCALIASYDGQLHINRTPAYSQGRDVDEFYQWVCRMEDEQFPELKAQQRPPSHNVVTPELQRVKIR